MNLNTDYIAPADLTGYVRHALADYEVNQLRLNRYLPNRMVDDIVARFLAGGQGLSRAAVFRTYDAESPISKRPGFQRTTIELPPISEKLRLGEYEHLRQRQDPELEVTTGLMSDAALLTRGIGARMELARADALINGTITLNENGLVAEVDFGRASGNTVTASTLWSDHANGDPVQDLITWAQAYVDLMGVDPGSIVMNRTTLFNALACAKLRIYSSTLAGTPTLATVDHFNAVLASYSLPAIDVQTQAVLVGDTATRVIPDGKVLLLPAPVADPNDYEGTQLGAVVWGNTAEAYEPEFSLVGGDLPGVTAGVYSTDDPVALWTKAAGIGLPVLANPNLSFAATVL